jgi:hypothetical protein
MDSPSSYKTFQDQYDEWKLCLCNDVASAGLDIGVELDRSRATGISPFLDSGDHSTAALSRLCSL